MDTVAVKKTDKPLPADKQGSNPKVYARAWVAVSLIVLWTSVTLSGLLLHFAPHGPKAGWHVLFLGLTKREWGDIHFWLSMATVLLTVVHIAIDRRALVACVRHLTAVRRTPIEPESK